MHGAMSTGPLQAAFLSPCDLQMALDAVVLPPGTHMSVLSVDIMVGVERCNLMTAELWLRVELFGKDEPLAPEQGHLRELVNSPRTSYRNRRGPASSEISRRALGKI